ncbi:protein phosphatase 2C domain-containing protein [Verrucosispora sp. WMMA2044]|nr:MULTISPECIES: protein phosphatase 2C domain-containing protein [Micromonospora]WBB46856.1 protein phosphatase 2C domain-containing protein [Verrucosispora sp. WMMA2044]
MSQDADYQASRFTLTDLTLEMAGGSVIGSRYRDNYDVLHVDPTLPFAVVADGMGDGAGSRRAGAAAVPTFAALVREAWLEVGADQLRTAADAVQSAVLEAGRGSPQLTGCTLTGLVVEPEGSRGWVVQLGDSRAYRLRNDLLELITTDHTIAWLGVLHGWYPADSPAAARARYQLTRYAGHPAAPEADLLAVTVRPGDTWLLCTDGVSDQVSYHVMQEALIRPEPADAVRTLLRAALDAGGADNASAVVVRAWPAS